MKIILIRYGELTLKGNNRKEFERRLYNNLNNQLKEFDVNFRKDRNRIYVELLNDEQYNEIETALKKVPGISSFSIATNASLNIEEICQVAIDNFDPSYDTFKVETKRSNKQFLLTSQDISKKVGGEILKAYDGQIKAKMIDPDLVVRIEIQADSAYVFTKVVKGLGGLPLGSSGRGIVLLSGGIDSPVAAIEAMKRGIKINCVHFSSPPYTNEQSFIKVIDILKVLQTYDKDIKLFDVNVAKLQVEMNKTIDTKYNITLLRRMMFRKATEIARRYRSNVLITGEAVGQVASQTVESMTATHSATDMLIMQPLVTQDKLEIIKKAKQYGTHDISIRPFDDCCVIFVSKTPIIKPKLHNVIAEEQKIDYETILSESEVKMYTHDMIANNNNTIDKYL